VTSQQTDAFKRYAKAIRETLRSGPTNIEQALAPSFKNLIDELLPTLAVGRGLTTVPEYANDVGRPDIALVRQGQLPRAFIELKAPDKHLDPIRWRDAHDKRQFGRFGELPVWALSNFGAARFFRRNEGALEVRIVPQPALDPTSSDTKADAAIDGHDAGPFIEILTFLAQAEPPSPSNAEQLAEFLAHAARLVRASVIEKLGQLDAAGQTDRPLQLVRDEFRNVLYAHPESGGYRGEFNTLFSAAFAQVLAFGLLLVREAINQPVGRDAWRHMPDEHPLMKTALRVLSEDEIVEQISLGFEVMFDTVNGFDPRVLAQRPGRGDPILYFYEEFLGTFDAEAKQRYGVYYTPVEVVRYMVGALDRALKDNLGTQGLVDPGVTILDPATGTGTFLLGIAERVREQVERNSGPGAVEPALRQLAERMFAFELLIGPYAVAHYRLHHALAEKPTPGNAAAPPLPRLGIYLADTLARPGTSTSIGPLGYTAQPIQQERDEADRIKAEQRILAIIGNPPYWRFQGVNTREVVGPFVDDLWDDLKEPVRRAGWSNQLNTFPEFSIAFWRWAIWKMFEADNAPQKGVIAFITNRTFLAGKPYAGLRKLLRERFDRIEVVDLRGDLRRGERAGVLNDEGVFNIQVGTAITLAIADGSKAEGELASITYADCWDQCLYSRRAKLEALEATALGGDFNHALTIQRGLLDDFKPVPFSAQGGWVALEDAFAFKSSGIQSKRDSLVYAISREGLIQRLSQFKATRLAEAHAQFNGTTTNPTDVAQSQSVDENLIVTAAYRPFDLRSLYKHRRYIDRPRPELQRAWGASNSALYAMPFATGEGPAAWCHALLPDYHSFRGSYGGYAFPLFDRRAGHGPINLRTELIDGLSLSYSTPAGPQGVFDAILGLLSATSYTLRFAEDLEDVFPHVPFPASKDVFDRAAAVGKSIREVETFQRPPDPLYLMNAVARIETTPRGKLAAIGPGDWDEGNVVLCDDGTGKVSGIPTGVWTFAVSGYRVLQKWLAGREGISVDNAFLAELRDITGRINELIHLFDEADLVLQDALNHTLTRRELGLE
jgi:hypothetical protein